MGKKPSGSPSVWARQYPGHNTHWHACLYTHTHTDSSVPLNKIPNPALTVQTQKKKKTPRRVCLGQNVTSEEKKEIKLAEQRDIDQNHT